MLNYLFNPCKGTLFLVVLQGKEKRKCLTRKRRIIPSQDDTSRLQRLQHVPGHTVLNIDNEKIEQGAPEKVIGHRHDDLTRGDGQGEGTDQEALPVAELVDGELRNEGHALPAFYHAHEGLDAP